MNIHIMAVITGYLLDLCLGDPHWMPHPVRGIGGLISWLDKRLGNQKAAPGQQRAAGVFMVAVVLLMTGGISVIILTIAYRWHLWLGFAAESILCYQMLAAKALKDESMKVYTELKRGAVEDARTAVSMIVGRDTKSLDEIGITKAAVETVAENTSDGVIAPLFYMAIGGGAAACLYKAINTMDSMVGYKNDQYLYFGWAAAKLDDLVNLVPARLSAALMIAVSFLCGMNGMNAVKIYRRDRKNHKSPNSAHTEAVCAGALGIQLAGDAYYFGRLHHKPVIGDDLRPVEFEDIKRANNLLYGTVGLAVGIITAMALILK